MSQQIYEAFCRAVGNREEVLEYEPMKRHTTFCIGGPARYFLSPKDSRELKAVLSLCRERNYPWFILGNGSNLLVSDRGFDGAVIQMGKGFSGIRAEGNQIFAGSGALLSAVARKAFEAGLTGLEFAAGIPGTLGGAVVMNAGAYGGEMKDVISHVQVLTKDGREEDQTPAQLKMGYRSSNIPSRESVVLGAVFTLQPGKRENIRARMEELAARRKEKQPLEYPSAGSTFKRPEGYFAGKLIQDAGFSGFQVGGAMVSPKHCGFVVNLGNASAAEVDSLCRQVALGVKEKFGVCLEMEVKKLGDFG